MSCLLYWFFLRSPRMLVAGAVLDTVHRPLTATCGPAKTHLGAQQLAVGCRYFDRHCELLLTGAGRLAPRDPDGDAIHDRRVR
jgi:hypothetical protein